MDELNVVVQEEPCQVKWNFEDLKTALAEQMSVYETMIYDDDSVPAARADVANLRKLRKAVEDKRIETKKACMEPYNVFEAQVKELTDLIDKPINYIDGRIKKYEQTQKAQRREEIMSYLCDGLSDIDGRIVDSVLKNKYDPRWENKTCSKKKWQEEADAVVKSVHDVMDQIGAMPAEFWEPCTVVYERTLDPASVMAKQNELQAQKQAIEDAVRKKEEAEARRIQEQEFARREAQQNVQKAEQETPKADQEAPKAQQPVQNTSATETQTQDQNSVLLRIYGTDKQIEKIKGYINFVEASFEEVRA